MSTVCIRIPAPPSLQELLIAELADLDFNAFEQTDTGVVAYGDERVWGRETRERLHDWLAASDLGGPVEEEVVPDVNWNARWEASMQPVPAGAFLIKPSWHDVPAEWADRIVLEIDPKMSFGTGYHPSTRLALRFLGDVVSPGDHVLDAGCGTGILALAALKLGAAGAIGFDIDEWARVNAAENAARNDLANRLEVREGAMDVVPETGFDVVLANINRNVLLELLPDFRLKVTDKGHLVMAGLLTSDRDTMLDAAAEAGFELLSEDTEGDWWSGLFKAV